MKLIDRYVAQVGQRLPAQSREDIEKELKSTLEDMLEDRARKAGRPADDALEMELLKEYGAPDKVADSYHPSQYIIGPRMYPTFVFVSKIVFSVLSGLALIGLIIALSQVGFAGHGFTQVLMQIGESFFNAVIMALGIMVVVFTLLERFLPDSEIKDLKMAEEWDPANLLQEPSGSRVKRGDLAAEIIFTFIGLLILNGIFNVPVFLAGFAKFIPWVNATFLAEILLDIYLLRNAAWTRPTRIVKVLIEVVSAAITVVLIRTPDVIGITAEALANIPLDSSVEVSKVVEIFNASVSIALIIILIVQGIELVKAIYGLLKHNDATK